MSEIGGFWKHDGKRALGNRRLTSKHVTGEYNNASNIFVK